MGKAVGEVEVDQQVLVLKKIHVTYELTAPGADRETIERVHSVHREGCPVYRSIHRAIEITTAVEMIQRFRSAADDRGAKASRAHSHDSD